MFTFGVKNVDVTCPADHPWAISGTAFDQATQLPVKNTPQYTGSNTGWHASSDTDHTLTLYVICAR
jgi:hypothetical protein